MAPTAENSEPDGKILMVESIHLYIWSVYMYVDT